MNIMDRYISPAEFWRINITDDVFHHSSSADEEKSQPGKVSLNNSLNDAPVSRTALKENFPVYITLSDIIKVQALFVSHL